MVPAALRINSRRLGIASSLQERLALVQCLLHSGRWPGQELQHRLEPAGRRWGNEDTQASGAAVQLICHARQAEMAGASCVGEPLDATGSGAERKVDAQHGGAGRKIDQDLARSESYPWRNGILPSLEEVGILRNPRLHISGNITGG